MLKENAKRIPKSMLLLVFISFHGCTDSLKEKKTALKIASDIRIQKVIMRLKEDCEANLQKETYKINQLQLKSKPQQIGKKKAQPF